MLPESASPDQLEGEERKSLTAIGFLGLVLVRSHSDRSARMGSVRVARQAGKKHAAVDARVITANAAAKAGGSRGLTGEQAREKECEGDPDDCGSRCQWQTS